MSSEVVEGIQMSKIPILKPDEFEEWKHRIKQHMLLTDYQMWDIVENGRKYKTDANGVRLARTPPTTDAERKDRSIELRAQSTLLVGLPNEYQKKFSKLDDAKDLMEAIEKRFGGNENTKKTKRSLLKQQFENFGYAKTETMSQTFDRFSKLVSELENHNVKIDKDDLNRKFLRSLGDEWTIYTVGLRQGKDLDEKELDDLYNDLKAFESEVESKKQSSSMTQATQNAAFVSMSKGNDDPKLNGSASHGSASHVYGSSPSDSGAQFRSVDPVMEAFFASHVNSSLTNDELEQINPEDLEEMDLKWQMAMITMRVKRYIQRTGRNNFALKKDDGAGFDKSKVECYNCHILGHFARECRSGGKDENMQRYGAFPKAGGFNGTQRRSIPVQDQGQSTSESALVSQSGKCFDWSDQVEYPFNLGIMKQMLNLKVKCKDVDLAAHLVHSIEKRIKRMEEESKKDDEAKIKRSEERIRQKIMKGLQK